MSILHLPRVELEVARKIASYDRALIFVQSKRPILWLLGTHLHTPEGKNSRFLWRKSEPGLIIDSARLRATIA